MASRTISYHQLVCDGCQTVFGEGVYFASGIECRAAAYGQGWRFPERYKKTSGEARTVNDICPRCEPTWERQPAQDNWATARQVGQR